MLTGVGKGSIGVEILQGLLSGGASCIVTTSRYSRATVDYYKNIFHEIGSKGSKLIVVPFNGGTSFREGISRRVYSWAASRQDIEALVDYIYSTLQVDLDYIIPFAALPENGREIDNIDDKSELAHRLMLTNLLRLLGAVKVKKAARQFVTRPTQVVLPLSPNHGLFGNDGLYSESKISLETLFNRWNAESWGEYLCIAGAVIGWTRGTGLMSATNTVAEGLEKLGVRTFSAKEMAFNILGLMHPLLFDITQIEPIWADLNGGMDRVADLNEVMQNIRIDINRVAELRKAITLDTNADFRTTNGEAAEQLHQKVAIAPRANFRFTFPQIEDNNVLDELSYLRGLIDLDKVIVCTGFAELGPWGSSRTRWEMEARGELTIEGCIELAWMMGYIKHFDGKLKDGKAYVGWVDAKSGEPVDDKDVRTKYEADITGHSGIRLIGKCRVRLRSLLTAFQNPRCSSTTTQRRKSSTKKFSSTMILSRWRFPLRTLLASSVNRATTAMFGPNRVESGSLSSREVPGSSFRKPSSSTELSRARYRQGGAPQDMGFLMILSHKPTVLPFGLSSAPWRL